MNTVCEVCEGAILVMAFRGGRWCSDDHRKLLLEVKPRCTAPQWADLRSAVRDYPKAAAAALAKWEELKAIAARRNLDG